VPFGLPKGNFLVHRTSANVGVSATLIGVGTYTFKTCST
jgi:hypothetical protein